MIQRNRSVNRKSSGNYSSRITKKKKKKERERERVDINYKKRIAKIHIWKLNNVL